MSRQFYLKHRNKGLLLVKDLKKKKNFNKVTTVATSLSGISSLNEWIPGALLSKLI